MDSITRVMLICHCSEMGLNMPYGSNRIIHFCGWWLELFGKKNCTCGLFHTVAFETVSLFYSYIYLRIPLYLGPR